MNRFAVHGFVLMSACLGMTSCGTPPPPRPQDLISVSEVLNSVKCGFALALYREGRGDYRFKRLAGNIATLELQLKITDTQTVGAEGKGTGIIAWQGGSISPYLSGSRANAWTADSVLKAAYKLDATNTNVCAAAGVATTDGPVDEFGFSDWLSGMLLDLSQVSLEKPTGTLSSLTYEAAFSVTRSGKAGVGLQIAVFTADLNAAKERIDMQKIKVVIAPKPAASSGSEKKPGETSTSSGGGLGPAAAIPNFSQVPPSPNPLPAQPGG